MTAKRRMTPEDLYRMSWVNDPVVSPASGAIAYVHKTVNEKRMATAPISGCFQPARIGTFRSPRAKRMAPRLGRRTVNSLLSYGKRMTSLKYGRCRQAAAKLAPLPI